MLASEAGSNPYEIERQQRIARNAAKLKASGPALRTPGPLGRPGCT